MPVFLGLVALAAVLWAREHSAHAATVPVGLQGLAPGAAAYLPPVLAPDDARVAYANAAASRNPMQIAYVAQQFVNQGQLDLARGLAAMYQQLTNNALPGVPTGAAAAGAVMDARTMQALRMLTLVRKEKRRRQMAQLLNRARVHGIARTA